MKLNPKIIGIIGMVCSAISMVASEYSKKDIMKEEIAKEVQKALQKGN